MCAFFARYAFLALAATTAVFTVLSACDSPSKTPKPHTDPVLQAGGDTDVDQTQKQAPLVLKEPTETNYWGKIPINEISAMLSFPPELAVMDNRVLSSVNGKTREIMLGRPTQDGHVDLIPLVIMAITRDKSKPIPELLEDTRRNLMIDKEPVLDLQQRDNWPIGGDGAIVSRQLIHYTDGKFTRHVKQFVWITDSRVIVLSFDAEESHYKRVSPYVSQVAETFYLNTSTGSDTSPK
jgi:hypothetical protein